MSWPATRRQNRSSGFAGQVGSSPLRPMFHLVVSELSAFARPPVNLAADEMLSALVERLLKALGSVRPQTVRQFFALANQHIRWELNDLSRRLDKGPLFVELESDEVPAPASNESGLSDDGCRMLEAIDKLPEDEREAFDLVRIQGLSHTEASQILGVTPLTVKRRLNRGLRLLASQLSDLRPPE